MILRDLWNKKVLPKLGSLGSFLPKIGDQIRMAIENDDADGLLARAHELDEAADAQKKLAGVIRSSVALDSDGVARITATEAATVVAAFDEVIDELEDVVKGYDEDDDPAPAA